MCDDITFFMLKFLIACSLELLMLLSIFLFLIVLVFLLPNLGIFTFTIKPVLLTTVLQPGTFVVITGYYKQLLQLISSQTLSIIERQ